MSFILDALKKSEAERQNQAGAGISNTPSARQTNQLPGWAIALIGVLVLAVVGLGWAWWQAQQTPRPPIETALPTGPVAAPAGGPVRDLQAEARLRESGREPPPNNETVATVSATASQPEPQPDAGVPAEPAAAGSVSAPNLPSSADLAAQGIALPDMNLDIHVFSQNKSERFVFINSAKYRQGDRLRDGPQVEEITADGVILRYQGTRFLLPRD